MKDSLGGMEKLCKPKCQGDLGFKDIENFNLAILGKQVWRLLHNKDSLFTRSLKRDIFLIALYWKRV